MKRNLLLLLIVCLVFSVSYGQTKVTEKDLKGEWKMIIDIDEDDIDEELEDEGPFERIIARSVSGFVLNLMEEIDIRFTFLKNHRLRIEVEVLGEREVEYSDWYINSHGELLIGDDPDDDEVWMMNKDRLVSYKNRHGRLREREVYMVRVD